MSVPWSKEDRISVIDYAARLKLGHKVNLAYYRKGKAMKTTVTLENNEPPIRKMYPGFEKIDYEMIAGFVFMPITVNHVMLLAQYAPKLIEYADPTKPIEPALLITHVLLNSPASKLRTIGVGGIIAEVNGQKVRTLDDLRSALLLGAQSKYLTFKTSDNQFAVIPVEDVLSTEDRLSSMYYYPLSDTYKELKQRVMESKK
jgi:S1-C subfamily serine protease